MGQSVGRKVGHGTSGEFYDIILGSLAFGHACVRNVRDIEELCLDFLLCALQLFVDGFLFFFEHGNAFFRLFCIVLASFFHGFADGGCHAVEFCSGVVVAELELAAEVVEGDDAGYRLGAVEALHGKTLNDKLGVCLNLL